MGDLEKSAGLGPRGLAFWQSTTAEYELSPAERELLTEVCRLLDTADRLQSQVDADGLMVVGSTGQKRLHPAVTELRGTRVALARLLAGLALPAEAGDQMPTPEEIRARKAAEARWAARKAQQEVSRGA